MAHPILAQITLLLGQFLSIEFGVSQAMGQIGTALPSSDPDKILLKPRGVKSDFVILHLEDLEFKSQFLSSIEIGWLTPQTMPLRDLEGLFGSARIIARPEAEAPDTYLFEIRHRPLRAVILVTVEDREKDDLAVKSITLRRMAPDPYRIEEGRAVRMVVMADLGAAAERPDPWPQPSYIWKMAGIDDLLSRLQPVCHFQVENRLSMEKAPLSLTYAPRWLADFSVDGVVWNLAPLAPLANLRGELAALARGEQTRENLRGLLTPEIPPDLRNELGELLSDEKKSPASMIAKIDAMLTGQCQILFAHPGFRAFTAAWLGLAFLADALDYEDGSRIEVYSTNQAQAVWHLQEGILESELSHPEGSPVAFILLGETFGSSAGDADFLNRLAALTSRIDAPIFFGVDSKPESLQRSGWARNISDANARYLAGGYPRFCLRPALGLPGAIPSCFEYSSRPGSSRPFSSDTAVWGSASWLLAASAAASQKKAGHLVDWGEGAPLSSLIGDERTPSFPLLEDLRIADDPSRALNPLLIRWRWDPGSARFKPDHVRSLAESAAAEEGFSARLVLGPVLGTIRRIEHQSERKTEPSQIKDRLSQALLARIPEAFLRVELQLPPTGSRRLAVELIPPFPVDGQRITLRAQKAWKAQ